MAIEFRELPDGAREIKNTSSYSYIYSTGQFSELDGVFNIEEVEQILAKMKELQEVGK